MFRPRRKLLAESSRPRRRRQPGRNVRRRPLRRRRFRRCRKNLDSLRTAPPRPHLRTRTRPRRPQTLAPRRHRRPPLLRKRRRRPLHRPAHASLRHAQAARQSRPHEVWSVLGHLAQHVRRRHLRPSSHDRKYSDDPPTVHVQPRRVHNFLGGFTTFRRGFATFSGRRRSDDRPPARKKRRNPAERPFRRQPPRFPVSRTPTPAPVEARGGFASRPAGSRLRPATFHPFHRFQSPLCRS